jgi:putative transposase
MLTQHRASLSAQELCRRHGASYATFYKLHSKYGGRHLSDARKLKALDDQNRRLKKLLASMLDAATSKRCREKLLMPRWRRLTVTRAIKDKSHSHAVGARWLAC